MKCPIKHRDGKVHETTEVGRRGPSYRNGITYSGGTVQECPTGNYRFIILDNGNVIKMSRPHWGWRN